MLFRNLVSGNVVSTTNEDVIQQMKKSPTYEPVVPSDPPAPEKKPVRKKASKGAE